MAQKLCVLQSLWAMERRLADEPEWPLQTQLAMIRDAGFDGAGVRFIDPVFASDVTGFLRAHGMIWQAQCYPKSVDDLKPVLELVAKLGADHINLQSDVRPHRLTDCIPLLEGWRRLGELASVPVNKIGSIPHERYLTVGIAPVGSERLTQSNLEAAERHFCSKGHARNKRTMEA